MNAAERQQLARLAETMHAFLDIPRAQVPRPDDHSLEATQAWMAEMDRADRRFEAEQRDRALMVAGHMSWITEDLDDYHIHHRIDSAIRLMAEEMAKPLPYPVRPGVTA